MRDEWRTTKPSLKPGFKAPRRRQGSPMQEETRGTPPEGDCRIGACVCGGGGGGVVFWGVCWEKWGVCWEKWGVCGEKWFYFGQTKLVGTLAKQRAHMLDFTKWTFGTSAAPVSFAFPQLL